MKDGRSYIPVEKQRKRSKVHRKYSNYYEYVANVVEKCSHENVILESKTFRAFKFEKYANESAKLPPGEHIKIVPARCKSYSCPVCGRKKVYDLIWRLHNVNLKGYRFFTLTLKNKKTIDDTEYNINRIAECFNKLNKALRKIPYYKNLEYFRVIEVGVDGMVHMHGIWNKYIPQMKLQKMWLQITGDSFIVKPEKIKSKADCIRYLYKYLTKNIHSKDMITVDPGLFNMDLTNTAQLFYENGKRRWQSSRNFFNRKLDKRKSDWIPYYYTTSQPGEIEMTIKYLVRDYGLTESNFNFSSYYESEQFLQHLFSKPPPT